MNNTQEVETGTKPDGAVTVGQYQGRNYSIKRRRICNILPVHRNIVRWFLWIEREYMGNFPTRRKAIYFLREEINGREVV